MEEVKNFFDFKPNRKDVPTYVDAKLIRERFKYGSSNSRVKCNLADFHRRFSQFTADGSKENSTSIFAGFKEWDNMVVAGGAVVASLLRQDSLDFPVFPDPGSWPNADIDIFLYGISTKDARQKVNNIANQLCQKFKAVAIRTAYTISLESQYFPRAIQIILRVFKEKEDAIRFFDVDCCAVMYDGDQVFGCQRSVDAIYNMCNIYDEKWRKGRSWYEDRLEKYVKRGFDIALRDTDKKAWNLDKVTAEIKQVSDFDPVDGIYWKTTLSHNIGIYRLALYKHFSDDEHSSFFIEERTKILPLPKARNSYQLQDYVLRRMKFPRNGYLSGNLEVGEFVDLVKSSHFGIGAFEGPKPDEMKSIWERGLVTLSPVVTTRNKMQKEKERRLMLLKDRANEHDKEPKYKEILKFYEHKHVEELHTHLIGMGTNTFWHTFVMCQFIPFQTIHRQHRRDLALVKSWFGPTSELPDAASKFWKDLGFPTTYFEPISHRDFNREPWIITENVFLRIMQQHNNAKDLCLPLSDDLVAASEDVTIVDQCISLFSSDVIYSIKDLIVAFNFTHHANAESVMERELKRENIVAEHYIIFNERKQHFDYVKGVKNGQIISSERLKKAIEDSMCCGPTDSQNAFTPQFYPRRYKLKDVIYEQRLDVLDMLMHYVVHRYYVSNVEYAEISVGVTDLCNPVVYRHLVLPVPPLSSQVTVRFLAGFGRWKQGEDSAKTEKALFSNLEKLKSRLTESEQAAYNGDSRISNYLLHRTLVGLDWNGDETKNSDCLFSNDLFIAFVHDQRRKSTLDFGLRIHAGEVTVPDAARRKEFNANMKVTVKSLKKLLDSGINCRIGHGVALAAVITLDDSELATIRNDALDILKKFPVEINCRSNKILLTDHTGVNFQANVNKHAIATINNYGGKTLLSTDNDGIFSTEFDELKSDPKLEHPLPLTHYSVAAEFLFELGEEWDSVEDLKLESHRFGKYLGTRAAIEPMHVD